MWGALDPVYLAIGGTGAVLGVIMAIIVSRSLIAWTPVMDKAQDMRAKRRDRTRRHKRARRRDRGYVCQGDVVA